MKRILAALILCIAAFAIQGCAENPTTGQTEVVTPQSATQTVYALEVSLTIATNALADLNASGVVTGQNYATAYNLQKQAHATLMLARDAVTAKDPDKVAVYVRTVSGLIDQLAVFTGGKK